METATLTTAEATQPVVVAAPPERETITIPAQLKQICGPASRRYALNALQFTPSGNGGYLAACDGRCLAIVRCESNATSEALIPRGVLPNAIPKAKGFLESSTYRVEKSNGRWFGEVWNNKGKPSGEGLQAAYPTEGKFPVLNDVVPNIPESGVAISLDADLLSKVAKAIGPSGGSVTLIAIPGRHEIIVLGESGAGLVMAKIVDDIDRRKSLYTDIVDGYKAARAKLK